MFEELLYFRSTVRGNIKTNGENTFQLNIVRCNILEEIKIVNREQCLIPCQLRYGNIENIELICIDTGSQTNVISICKLHKVFGKLEFDLQSVTVELKAANNII